MDEKISIGKRLKHLRGTKSQEDVAFDLGISRARYSHYETDRVEPDIMLIKKMASYYKVTTDYLLGGIDKPQLTSKVIVAGQEISLSAEEFQLFNELKKHPVLFHDLASDPENKVKELIKLYKMKKIFLDDDENEEYGDGFGELED